MNQRAVNPSQPATAVDRAQPARYPIDISGRLEHASTASFDPPLHGAPNQGPPGCFAPWACGLVLVPRPQRLRPEPSDDEDRRTSSSPASTCTGSGSRTTRPCSRTTTSCPTCSRTRRSPSRWSPSEIIREEAVFNLRDALRNVTGISLAAGEGGGAQGDNLTLRGFSARNDIFTDGMRDFGQYTRDTFDLESVEVLKGPSSVLFGRGSTGGVINQVTQGAEARRRATPFTGTAGTGPFFRTTVDINQPLADTVGASGSTACSPTPASSTATRRTCSGGGWRRRSRSGSGTRPSSTPATTTWATTTCPTTASPTSSASRPTSTASNFYGLIDARLREGPGPHRHASRSSTRSTTTSACATPCATPPTRATRSCPTWPWWAPRRPARRWRTSA